MANPLDAVGWARLPTAALAALAEVRCHPDVTVYRDGARAWVRWPAGQDEVLRRVLTVPGVELFEERDGLWFRHGRRLPAPERPPAEDGSPLAAVLFPAPVQPVPPPAARPSPVTLRLVPDDRPRRATALLAPLPALQAWADQAPTADFVGLHGACLDGIALVRGQRLPPVADALRLWGDRLLIPAGSRPDPAWPESGLAAALGLTADDLGLLTAEGLETIAPRQLRPLSRGNIRKLIQS